MKNVLEVIEKNQIKDIKTFSGMNELKMNFPYANFQTGDEAPMGLLETQRAGHISPRKFVAAQCKIASSTCDCHIKVIRKLPLLLNQMSRMRLNGALRLKILPIVTARLNSYEILTIA